MHLISTRATERKISSELNILTLKPDNFGNIIKSLTLSKEIFMISAAINNFFTFKTASTHCKEQKECISEPLVL